MTEIMSKNIVFNAIKRETNRNNAFRSGLRNLVSLTTNIENSIFS
jgi:hypothetical protein